MNRSAIEGPQLRLLGGSEIRCAGNDIRLPLSANRLLCFLALQDGGAQRAAAAEALWPDHRPGRAAANLRSALWQARRIGTATVVDCAGQRISLAPTVDVDVWSVARHAHQIVASDSLAGLDGYAEVVDALARELLPDWAHA